MANFSHKIVCPNPEHEETTPSCAVYDDGSGYCFGCLSYFKILDEEVQSKSMTPKIRDDLEGKLKEISTYATMTYRGLDFPYNAEGYYIVWPNKDYYKCRRWMQTEGQAKYSNPRGHAQPMFFLESPKKSSKLIVVEGEINALSIRSSIEDYDIVSPGGVSNFNIKKLREGNIPLNAYSSVIIFADGDVVGFKAAISLKQELQEFINDVVIHLLENDMNEILTKGGGHEEIKKIIRSLEM